ncbi:hypothetical protein [Kibdelosporangium philippinense]|uniref:hypothetical protein n=1 Tax=Kibdelosporangium philippinense TaxID=211113 RepID=UPI00360FB8DA
MALRPRQAQKDLPGGQALERQPAVSSLSVRKVTGHLHLARAWSAAAKSVL